MLDSNKKNTLEYSHLLFFRTSLFDFQKLVGKSPNDNLNHAFTKAFSEFNISPLLEPEGKNCDSLLKVFHIIFQLQTVSESNLSNFSITIFVDFTAKILSRSVKSKIWLNG